MAEAPPITAQQPAPATDLHAQLVLSSDIKDFGYTPDLPFHCPTALQEDSGIPDFDAKSSAIPETIQNGEQENEWKSTKMDLVETIDIDDTGGVGEVVPLELGSQEEEGQSVVVRSTPLECPVESPTSLIAATTPTTDTTTADTPIPQSKELKDPSLQSTISTPPTQLILKRLSAALHYTRWGRQKKRTPRASPSSSPIFLPTTTSSIISNTSTRRDNGIQARRLRRPGRLNPGYINLNNVPTANSQTQPSSSPPQTSPQLLRLSCSDLTGELSIPVMLPETQTPVSVAVVEVTPGIKTLDPSEEGRQGKRVRRRGSCF